MLAKVALGEGDAGFVYATDARTVPGKVKVIAIPAWAQPKVRYGICSSRRADKTAAAQAFVTRCSGRPGQRPARATASCRA